MKVVYFAGYTVTKVGGVEKHLLELNRQLAISGDQLLLVFPDYPRSKQFVDISKENQVPYIIIRENSGIIGKLKFFIESWWFLIHYRANIVHVNVTPYSYMALLSAYFSGVKKRFCTEHCIPYYAGTKKQLFIVRLMSLLCNKVIGVSNRVTTIFKEKFNIQNAVTLYLGIDTNVRRERKRGVEDKPVIITNIAFHSKVKGVDVFLEAIYELKNMTNKKFEVLQIGEHTGDYSASLIKYVDDNNLNDVVTFLGIREDIEDLLATSDIYCNTSRSEALCLALLEASLLKIPLVATNIGGVPEVVNDNCNGFLVESENPKMIAERLKMLLLDENLRVEMGNIAYENVKSKFNIENQIEKLIRLYKQEATVENL